MPDMHAQMQGGSLDVEGVLLEIEVSPIRRQLIENGDPLTPKEVRAVRAAWTSLGKLASVRVRWSKANKQKES